MPSVTFDFFFFLSLDFGAEEDPLETAGVEGLLLLRTRTREPFSDEAEPSMEPREPTIVHGQLRLYHAHTGNLSQRDADSTLRNEDAHRFSSLVRGSPWLPAKFLSRRREHLSSFLRQTAASCVGVNVPWRRCAPSKRTLRR